MTRKTKPVALSCRPFDRDEWESLRDLRLEALQTNPGFFGSNYAKEKDLPEKHWRDTAQSEGCMVFGLFAGDDPIGCVGIATMQSDPSGESAVLWGTFIKPAWRGKGLSAPLYQTLIAYAKTRRDWKRIVVSHRDTNEASKHATLSHGFKYTHSLKKDWPDGGQEDEVCYALALAKA